MIKLYTRLHRFDTYYLTLSFREMCLNCVRICIAVMLTDYLCVGAWCLLAGVVGSESTRKTSFPSQHKPLLQYTLTAPPFAFVNFVYQVCCVVDTRFQYIFLTTNHLFWQIVYFFLTCDMHDFLFANRKHRLFRLYIWTEPWANDFACAGVTTSRKNKNRYFV